MKTLSLSVTILTKNSQRYLAQCLESVANFDEVIILDNGSTDNTLEIARQFPNVKIFTSPFIGFGPLKNLAASYARNEWVFSLDSDEVLTKKLTQTLSLLHFDETKAYMFNRLNHYKEMPIKYCGWYPDRVIRLYNRNTYSFSQAMVHEKIDVLQTNCLHIQGDICHYPFDNALVFPQKMLHYASLYAKQKQGKKVTLGTIIGHTFFAFFKKYFLEKGVFHGFTGLLLSFSHAEAVFYKYATLYELNTFPEKENK